MTDTDYASMSNAELDELVAVKVMGWHVTSRTPRWADGKGGVHGLVEWWNPTTDGADSARLLRHLWGTGRVSRIAIEWLDESHTEEAKQVGVLLEVHRRGKSYSVDWVEDPAADPNGFRALAEAALQAYRREAGK
jgi:hypothetical protein